ncbi:MAG TPA: radical SAM protein [Candidatus Eisenbacteria bacterium]|nr:radical SAM protein [Candidatus Eisenbacteria bacterium]
MARTEPIPLTAVRAPSAPALALDTVWFQVAGTICNLRCRHCFISCGPANRSHDYMPRDSVRRYLSEAESMGARDFYFTGGEPFLHKELDGILEDALRVGPASVLTNATLVSAERARSLARLERASRYALEMRVSLDGLTAAMNDPIRGEGTFDATVAGMRVLSEAGFLPIVTVARTWDDADDVRLRAEFHAFLRGEGIARPRVKILPLFLLGRETTRSRGYAPAEILTDEHLRGYDFWNLQCSNSRMVTSRGVYVCPILIDAPDALLAPTLRESMRPFPLAHGACHTCWATGASCRN